MKNQKTWPADFGLYKPMNNEKKSLLIKLTLLSAALILLLFAIAYTTLSVVNNNIPIENTNSSINVSRPAAAKLTGHPVSVEKQTLEHISPRPFVNDLRGASPSGFSPFAELATTPHYPQYSNHRPEAHPNNIQDIIEYLSENAHRQKELIREEQNFANSNNARDKFKLYGRIQNPHRHNHQLQHTGFNYPEPQFPQDPFFAFKPQDPSDINLLAPSSFRFAPAILSTNFYKNKPKVIQEAANSLANISYEGRRKPLSLTLNIYPSRLPTDNANENRMRFQGPGVTPRYRYYPPTGIQRARSDLRPRRMVLHLNVYPGGGSLNNTLEEESGHIRLPTV